MCAVHFAELIFLVNQICHKPFFLKTHLYSLVDSHTHYFTRRLSRRDNPNPITWIAIESDPILQPKLSIIYSTLFSSQAVVVQWMRWQIQSVRYLPKVTILVYDIKKWYWPSLLSSYRSTLWLNILHDCITLNSSNSLLFSWVTHLQKQQRSVLCVQNDCNFDLNLLIHPRYQSEGRYLLACAYVYVYVYLVPVALLCPPWMKWRPTCWLMAHVNVVWSARLSSAR